MHGYELADIQYQETLVMGHIKNKDTIIVKEREHYCRFGALFLLSLIWAQTLRLLGSWVMSK